jgi:hypothetical protein
VQGKNLSIQRLAGAEYLQRVLTGTKPISREKDLPDITNPNFRVHRF